MSNATQPQQYREVQRKANAGERIMIVNAGYAGYPPVYANGDILIAGKTVLGGAVEVNRYWNTGGAAWMREDEYVVLEPIATPAQLTASLPDLFAQFIRDNAPAVRSYLAEIDPVDSAEVNVEVTQSLTRAKVIEMARERVAELERIGRDDGAILPSGDFHDEHYGLKFRVNRERRTVVAEVMSRDGSFRKAKAYAKAAPDDVFNADIGKAIAAERALGLTLTPEFVNAPKPADDKLAPGTIVYLNEGRYEYKLGERRPEKDGACDVGFAYWLNAGWDGANNFTKLDDTDAVYPQETREACEAA